MVESLGATGHHVGISSHPCGKISSDATVLIRGTFLHPNMVLDKGTTTKLSKQSFIQAHNDRRIDKGRLVFKKNRRNPSTLPVSEQDSVQGPVKPNIKTTAAGTTSSSSNQSNADLVIKSPVSASVFPGINRNQCPTWDPSSTSFSNGENSKHYNLDPEQHAMYVGVNSEIADLHKLASCRNLKHTDNFWSKIREEYRGTGPLSIPISDIMQSGLDDVRSRIFTPNGSYLGEAFGCLFT